MSTHDSAIAVEEGLHGVMGEFADMTALVHAIERARKAGYRDLDAYTPFPSHEVSHALHLPASKLPAIVLAGGTTGLVAGYFMQFYTAAVDLPTNIGGRPLNSWPYFIPVTFECTILGAALAAVVGMFALNRLPQPYHPVFNHETFASASSDGFFLCIEASDPQFDRDEVHALLCELEASHVADVPR